MSDHDRTPSGLIETAGIEPVPPERGMRGERDIGLVFVGIFSHLLSFVLGAEFVGRLGLPAGLGAGSVALPHLLGVAITPVPVATACLVTAVACLLLRRMENPRTRC